MIAILSDIHGNLEALEAVLQDIARQRVTKIYNLGDVTGYGPNPVECLEHSSAMELALIGNFDSALLSSPEDFCQSAKLSVYWSQAQVKHHPELLDFLKELQSHAVLEGTLHVHGSPRNPRNEYVFPEDIHNPKKMNRCSVNFDRFCFAGHTHIPGFFNKPPSGEWEYLHGEEAEKGLTLGTGQWIINVGAVGQPRDGDPRACHALFDGQTVTIRRVYYDIATTARKIRAIPELDNFLGERLIEGR
ncbi:MAG: metallophosphoesterase family protein [Fimbriiglobus sp.]